MRNVLRLRAPRPAELGRPVGHRGPARPGRGSLRGLRGPRNPPWTPRGTRHVASEAGARPGCGKEARHGGSAAVKGLPASPRPAGPGRCRGQRPPSSPCSRRGEGRPRSPRAPCGPARRSSLSPRLPAVASGELRAGKGAARANFLSYKAPRGGWGLPAAPVTSRAVPAPGRTGSPAAASGRLQGTTPSPSAPGRRQLGARWHGRERRAQGQGHAPAPPARRPSPEASLPPRPADPLPRPRSAGRKFGS